MTHYNSNANSPVVQSRYILSRKLLPFIVLITSTFFVATCGGGKMPFIVSAEVDGEVSSISVHPDGKILIFGGFTKKLLQLSKDGSTDASFTPPTLDGSVKATLVQGDGKILIGIAGQSDGKSSLAAGLPVS